MARRLSQPYFLMGVGKIHCQNVAGMLSLESSRAHCYHCPAIRFWLIQFPYIDKEGPAKIISSGLHTLEAALGRTHRVSKHHYAEAISSATCPACPGERRRSVPLPAPALALTRAGRPPGGGAAVPGTGRHLHAVGDTQKPERADAVEAEAREAAAAAGARRPQVLRGDHAGEVRSRVPEGESGACGVGGAPAVASLLPAASRSCKSSCRGASRRRSSGALTHRIGCSLPCGQCK